MTKSGFRIGIGYDIHPLEVGRRLMLGGVEIPYQRGLSGHSDADVLLHAICDALLGALALGDLGMFFPENEKYRDASSIILLEEVASMVGGRGYRVVNVDCIIHAEEPLVTPFKAGMTGNISRALGVGEEDVCVKATRGEGMGPVGEKRAIAARAVVLLEKMEG